MAVGFKFRVVGFALILVAFAGTLALSLYSSSNEFQLCDRIRNCTVNVVQKHPDETICYYQLIANNRYHCDYRFCTCIGNDTVFPYCPINGSRCHISLTDLGYCYEHGFAILFDCKSIWIRSGVPIASVLVCCVSFVMAIFAAMVVTPEVYRACCSKVGNQAASSVGERTPMLPGAT